MTISNFSVTPGVVVAGESIHVEFTISVTSSDTVNGLTIYGGNASYFVVYMDDSFTLAAGKSTTISFDTVISKNNGYISDKMGSNRYITDPKWEIVLGAFGSSVEIANPIIYLNMRYKPTISEFNLKRAIDGAYNDEGVHVLTSMKLAVASGATTSDMSLKLYYAQSTTPTTSSSYLDLTSQISDLITGVSDSETLISNSFSNGTDWNFLLVFGDQWEQTTAPASIQKAFANLHLSGFESGGACFGGFSSSTEGVPKLESRFPAYFYSGINGVTNYSTEEVATGGTWIDGKPIYCITVSGSASTSSGTAKTVTVATIADVDAVVDMRGAVNRSGAVFPLTLYGGNSSNHHRTSVTDGVLKFTTTHTATVYATILYTKTTD